MTQSETSGAMEPLSPITFVGNARCYHTMDWYRTVLKIVDGRVPVDFLTDLIDSEGHRILVSSSDKITRLVIIDKFLFPIQSSAGDKWRNMVKLAFAPVQALALRKYYKSRRGHVYHAHTMYYMLVCWLAGVPFIGTPQGSEVLVRPFRSKFYSDMAKRLLAAATPVTVDSIAMRDGVTRLAGAHPVVIQNGIDVDAAAPKGRRPRTRVVSIRGMTDLYRIVEIVVSRNESSPATKLDLIYPFWGVGYRASVDEVLQDGDVDHGRMERAEMYQLLHSAVMAVSIPQSDSSPRSVYEAIFAGAAVATVAAAWIDALPDCMKSRLVIVDLDDPAWFAKALDSAASIVQSDYVPSMAAIETFSQAHSMRKAVPLLYGAGARGRAANGDSAASGSAEWAKTA
jgi:hypothetical protein